MTVFVSLMIVSIQTETGALNKDTVMLKYLILFGIFLNTKRNEFYEVRN